MRKVKNKILIGRMGAGLFVFGVTFVLNKPVISARGVMVPSYYGEVEGARSGQAANKTGIVPNNRISWVKNPLITRIKFYDAIVRDDSVKLRFHLSYINNSGEGVKWTAMPTPGGPAVRMYSAGQEILPEPPKQSDVVPYVAAPRDEQIKANSSILKAHDVYTTAGPAEFVVMNDQFLPGTHIYEIVYWHSQLDWIDVREYLERTDSQGKGRMMYPITDNAPSNRLYFKVYKPTEEEAKQGRHIEFLGEVDAKTQGPQFPFARPGDFAPRTGYWQAVGKSIDAIGGYHETFVKEGDSMPNLSGKVGVDPFSFQWKFIGDQSAVSARMKRNQKIFHEDDSIDR
ncbi:hypothetical protein [Burkholderia sp. PR2]|uniref:hypothetical protein n=1 Tax=Burkholderia sp. PR2 TaxID=3448078 RepID=UPI00402A72FE